MGSRLQSMARSGSILALAELVLGSGCGPNRRPVAPFATPQPLQLQTVVAIDKDGGQVLAGSFAGSLQIDGGKLVSAGGRDIFVVKSDKAGKIAFAKSFGGKGDDAATGVAFDPDGSIVVAGTFQGQANFDSKPLEAKVRIPAQRGVFVARLLRDGSVDWVRQISVVNVPTQISVAVAPDHSIVVGASSAGSLEKPDGKDTLAGESLVLINLNQSGDPIPSQAPRMLMSGPLACEHDLCHADWSSPPLVAGCGMYGVTATICLAYVDPYCCTVHWDPYCVEEVTSVTYHRCDCSGLCTEGWPFYPDACPIAGNVIANDSACGTSNWGSNCVSLARTFGAGCP